MCMVVLSQSVTGFYHLAMFLNINKQNCYNIGMYEHKDGNEISKINVQLKPKILYSFIELLMSLKF